MQNTFLTLFLSILFVCDIGSQNVISDRSGSFLSADTLVLSQTDLAEQATYRPFPATRQYSQKPNIAFYIKAGPGISQLYLRHPILPHTSVQKERWGFSANLGAGVRFRLSGRSDLEFDVNALQMKSTIEGLMNTSLIIGSGSSFYDTISVQDQTIKANWVNLQFALKFRYQPKRNLPFFLHAGIGRKMPVMNRSLQTTYTTRTAELVYDLSGVYTYHRLTTPLMKQSENKYHYDDFDMGVIFSLEFAPFQYRLDHLSFEVGFNQTFSDPAGFKRQRFLFGAAKFTFK